MRSNYSAEDGELYSFAGQFFTSLNVKRDNVKNAVEKVVNSEKNAEHYVGAHSIKTTGNMQVIVQEMINADYSGVIFTANPQGILNEIVLIVGSKTGDLVVEDKTPVTTYYYNITDNVYYSETKENSPVLKPDILSLLFSQAQKIQKLFNFYADIEFCIKDNVIYFLQVRKVTTIKDDKKIILDSSNISESYPGITLPCSQSFARIVYYSAFKSCANILTCNSKVVNNLNNVLENMVHCTNGRMYYLISNWYHLLKILPFSRKIIPIWQEMLGVTQKDVPSTSYTKPSFFVKVKICILFAYYMVVTPKKMQQLNNFFSNVYTNYKTCVQNTNNSAQLFSLLQTIIQNVGSKWGITLINDMYAFIYTSLAKKINAANIANIHKLESLNPVLAINKLAKTAKEHGLNSNEYTSQKEQYLNKYGDRCLEELKLESKTMNTNPEMLDVYINNYEYNEIKTPHAEDTSGDKYIVRCAKKGIFNRELSRMNRTRLYGLARSIFYKIGTNFVKDGIIAAPDDIFYLYINEIEQCINEKKVMQQTITNRKHLYEEYENLPAYTRLVFQQKVFDKAPLNAKIDTENFNKGFLQGTPSSGGIVRASVLVVKKPSLNINTSGKILVTDITDPGWVFLIKNAKGVIAQRGSLLSHTAIITRELKKPSVVGVAGVMSALKTGDVVELNGDTGVITKINT